MTALNLLYAVLVLHICGITLWAGSTVTEFILFKQFWEIHGEKKENGIAYRLISHLSSLSRMGIALLILSGITMYLITGEIFGMHTWFQVKMILVLIAIINSLINRRRLGTTLRNLLKSEANINIQSFEVVKRKMKIFHIVQISIFVTIFICSIYKFN